MAKKELKYAYNHEKSTHENTAKEQPYLMPGTPEYEEYQRDLKEHIKQDDEWHDKLEDHNENHSERLQNRNDESDGLDTNQSKREYQKHIAKESQFGKVKADAVSAALLTKTPDDDERARKAKLKDLEDLIYDNGVTQDNFEQQALLEYD